MLTELTILPKHLQNGDTVKNLIGMIKEKVVVYVLLVLDKFEYTKAERDSRRI